MKVKTEDGKPFEAALVDVGWDRGSISGSILKQQDLTLTIGPFALELHEAGFVAEDGATYITPVGRHPARRPTRSPAGCSSSACAAGSPATPTPPASSSAASAPRSRSRTPSQIEVHGSYRNEVPAGRHAAEGARPRRQDHDLRRQEAVGPVARRLLGPAHSRSPRRGIDYLLFQAVLFGAIPMGPIELRQIEALYADGLHAEAVDASDAAVGQLKYYPWLKKARPTALPEDRGLTAWKPQQDAWAFGAGFGVSFTGCGELMPGDGLRAGLRMADETDGSGLIVVIELKLLGKDKPIAVGVFEYDFRSDALHPAAHRRHQAAGPDRELPASNLKVQLGGTVTIGNKPGLVAVGRLDSQDTWLGGEVRDRAGQPRDAEDPHRGSASSGWSRSTSAAASCSASASRASWGP